MSVYFKNSTSGLVWVSYGYYAPGCEGGVDWAKKGWYEIVPNTTIKVHNGPIAAGRFFFYAESGSISWSGEYFTHLPWSAFEWCWNTGSTSSRILGMRKVEAGSVLANYTVTLT